MPVTVDLLHKNTMRLRKGRFSRRNSIFVLKIPYYFIFYELWLLDLRWLRYSPSIYILLLVQSCLQMSASVAVILLTPVVLLWLGMHGFLCVSLTLALAFRYMLSRVSMYDLLTRWFTSTSIMAERHIVLKDFSKSMIASVNANLYSCDRLIISLGFAYYLLG